MGGMRIRPRGGGHSGVDGYPYCTEGSVQYTLLVLDVKYAINNNCVRGGNALVDF
jgi:hypothetical protein